MKLILSILALSILALCGCATTTSTTSGTTTGTTTTTTTDPATKVNAIVTTCSPVITSCVTLGTETYLRSNNNATTRDSLALAATVCGTLSASGNLSADNIKAMFGDAKVDAATAAEISALIEAGVATVQICYQQETGKMLTVENLSGSEYGPAITTLLTDVKTGITAALAAIPAK